MSALENAIVTLTQAERQTGLGSYLGRIDARAKLIVTVLYILALLTVPLRSPDRLVLFALYPVIAAALAQADYRRVAAWSLTVVPMAAAVAAFNPVLDRQTAFYVGNVAVSGGWASFVTIVLRAVLAVQALMVLILSTGFGAACHAMRRLGMPAIFCGLLLMIYRYLIVLLREAVSMDRARRSRGFGRRHYPLRLWAVFVGQLLIRSMDRAGRVQRAMEARGYDGALPTCDTAMTWSRTDTLYTLAMAAYIAVVWLIPVHSIFNCL